MRIYLPNEERGGSYRLAKLQRSVYSCNMLHPGTSTHCPCAHVCVCMVRPDTCVVRPVLAQCSVCASRYARACECSRLCTCECRCVSDLMCARACEAFACAGLHMCEWNARDRLVSYICLGARSYASTPSATRSTRSYRRIMMKLGEINFGERTNGLFGLEAKVFIVTATRRCSRDP